MLWGRVCVGGGGVAFMGVSGILWGHGGSRTLCVEVVGATWWCVEVMGGVWKSWVVCLSDSQIDAFCDSFRPF